MLETGNEMAILEGSEQQLKQREADLDAAIESDLESYDRQVERKFSHMKNKILIC